ncbi:tetratricopeptide repeat protein [Jannaschia sp. AI_61]|uniref:tetratricopeptide repeat protein n=1 Tax=Jannaschia sp. AI_61 TaxID=2829796 RepID=UPI001C7DCABF|nr:tetratricopeptide repeat protein [Jannaschia sp. AI_61]
MRFARFYRSVTTASLVSAVLVLAACQSSEEKAAAYYQSGLALLEAGETERAKLEFRNVFKHDGFHREARQVYAEILVEQGNLAEAYSQYLRLVEQYPDAVDARLTLAEMAVQVNNWDDVARHSAAALALRPEDPIGLAVDLALQYHYARLSRDTTAQAEVVAQARSMLAGLRADDQNNPTLVRIQIDHIINGEDPASALPLVEDALVWEPEARDLNLLKLRLLAISEDMEAMGQQLQHLIALFPEDTVLRGNLVDWYMARGDLDGAEAYLRDLAGPVTGPTEGHVSVVQFLQSVRGDAAARAELDRLIAANAGTEAARLYGAMAATLIFAAGDAETAIPALQALLADAPAEAQTWRLQAMLAQMLQQVGRVDEAKAQVATILEADPSHVTALQMQARWLVAEDNPGAAIIALRAALNQNPRDAETLTLMAAAYQRNGDLELMADRLALAVEVSGNGRAESLRYAQLLRQQERPQVAITVLEDALRRAPNDLQLLIALADIYLNQRDWTKAQDMVDVLRDLETTEAQQAVISLQVAILQGQNRVEDSLALLEAQVQDTASEDTRQAVRSVAQIVRARILAGRLDAARRYLDETMERFPDLPDLELLSANLHALSGEMDAAEVIYRDLIERFPNSEVPPRLLAGLLSSTDRPDGARAVIEAALTRLPDAPTLLGIKANQQEQDGDLEGSIATYEMLYARDSSNIIIANNLASLLSTVRSDTESLERAATIARRLRGSEVPHFQDTYGWIEYRRGNHGEAVRYLEPAAAALPTVPSVQLHLGLAYASNGQGDQAVETLTRALEMAGANPPARFEQAREVIDQLTAGPGDASN